MVFLPQEPYMVLGPLRDQVLYPRWVQYTAVDVVCGTCLWDRREQVASGQLRAR